MVSSYGNDLDIVDRKRRCFDYRKIEFRDTGIFLFRKNIGIHFLQGLQHSFFPVHIHGLLMNKIKSTDIIQPANMVAVLMGKQHGIKFFYVGTKHLFSKVGASIYYQSFPLCFYHHGSA